VGLTAEIGKCRKKVSSYFGLLFINSEVLETYVGDLGKLRNKLVLTSFVTMHTVMHYVSFITGCNILKKNKNIQEFLLDEY